MNYTKAQVLDRLNGTNQFVTLEAEGVCEDRTASMPILTALRAIVTARGLKPGEDCEIIDYRVTEVGIEITYTTGEFKLHPVVPEAVGSLFGGGKGTTRFPDGSKAK